MPHYTLKNEVGESVASVYVSRADKLQKYLKPGMQIEPGKGKLKGRRDPNAKKFEP